MATKTSRLRALVNQAPEDAKPAPKAKIPPIDQERIRDVSLHVYQARLGHKDAAQMLERDGIEKMRSRAGIYDGLTVAYFQALGIEVPRVTVTLMGEG
jgi:hypothetical protein